MDLLQGTRIAVPILLTTFVYFISLALYRLIFHPLAHIPGPKLAALSRWYEAYYDIIKYGQYTWKIAELHKEYGPIIRISPYELHVIEPKFYETLFRQEGRWDKHEWTYKSFGASNATVSTCDHYLHRRRRAPLNHFFSRATVASRREVIQNNVNKLRDRLDGLVASGSVFNIGVAVSATGIDISTEYSIGRNYKSLDKEDFNLPMVRFLQGSFGQWTINKHFPFFYPVMKTLPESFVTRLNPDVGEFMTYLRKNRKLTQELMSEFESREKEVDEFPGTLVGQILQAPNLPPSEKSLERVGDEVDVVIGAGYETVSTTLRLILYFLYSNPSIIPKLRAELNGRKPEDMTTAQLESLPYLSSVIMEGLRMSPGLATRTARVAPDRNIVYGKYTIPPGTPVGMTTLLMHLDEELYPDPWTFNPDRWADPEKRLRADKTWAPFSRGARICLGMHVAWAELFAIISMIANRYDLELVDTGPEHVLPYRDEFIVGTKNRDMVKVRGIRIHH